MACLRPWCADCGGVISQEGGWGQICFFKIILANNLSTCTIVFMDIIADTNIFLAVALNEPEKADIVRLTAGTRAIAPEILPYEIGNALTAMLKRKRLSEDEVLSAYHTIQKIPVRLMAVDIKKALGIAIEFTLYAYDAYFLQCAKELKLPLLTLDKKMQRVATELNIKLWE